MKKIFYILFFLLTFSSGSFSQGLFNNGALIVIQTGALVKVDGDANGNYLNTTSTTDGRIDINGNMQVDAHWTNNASGGGHVFINIGTNGTVSFVGTTQQDVGGTAWTDFENLTLNNSAGARMTVDVNRVNGTLTLTSGALRLNSYTLIENNTSSVSITRTSGYIESEAEASKLQWNIGATTGTYTYPFGTPDADYIPFIASITAATGTDITVSTWHTATNNFVYPSGVTNMNDGTGDDISIDHVADRFWVPVYSNYTAGFRFTYDNIGGTNDIGALDESTLLAQSWNGISSWVAPPVGTNDAGNDNVNSVPGLSRPWVLADKDNPLPVELLTFNAVCGGEKVNVNWSTASETNNDYFSVERSADAIGWDNVTYVDGAGNSNTWLYYSAVDNEPLDGVSYYRMKQTDFDGAFSYSDPVQVGCENEDAFNLISVIPGLQNNELILFFTAKEDEQYNVTLFDARGRLIKNLSGKSVSGLNEIHFIAGDISEGIYMLTLQNNSKYFGQKILLK